MSQDCFHQTLICLQKICVDNLKKKKKKFAIQTRSNKNVCVCLCVYLCVLRADIEPSRYVVRTRVCVCACTVGWTPSPLPSIYTSLPSCISLCLSLSVSGCLSFVFFSLQSARFIYSFEFPDVCLCAAHTDFRHTHSI